MVYNCILKKNKKIKKYFAGEVVKTHKGPISSFSSLLDETLTKVLSPYDLFVGGTLNPKFTPSQYSGKSGVGN